MPSNRSSCGVRYRHLTKRKYLPDEHNAYKQRDECLFRLGFASYRDYLNSQLWTVIRTAKLESNPNCELCDNVANHVHHQSYRLETLIGKNIKPLVSLCEPCHRRVEFRPDGTKRNFEAVMKTVRRLLQRKRRRMDQGSMA